MGIATNCTVYKIYLPHKYIHDYIWTRSSLIFSLKTLVEWYLSNLLCKLQVTISMWKINLSILCIFHVHVLHHMEYTQYGLFPIHTDLFSNICVKQNDVVTPSYMSIHVVSSVEDIQTVTSVLLSDIWNTCVTLWCCVIYIHVHV